MQSLGNDRWQAGFQVEEIGRYEYTVEGWIDRFGSWRHELSKKFGAGQDVKSELLEGAAIVRETIDRVGDAADLKNLEQIAATLGDESVPQPERVAQALAVAIEETMAQVRGPGGGDPLRPRPAGRRRARARALRRVVRDVSALVGNGPRRRAAPSRTPPPCCPTSPRWASTCSTCRRSIRSAAASARGRTTRSTRDRKTSAARGRSGPRREATTPSSRRSAPSKTSTASSRKRPASASRSRSTSPIRRRPIIRTSRHIPPGSGSGPTERSNTRRTRRRSIRTSTRSTSSRASGQRCGRS